MIFVFDVDGTITPSRGKMDPEFKEFFLNFCKDKEVHLVTGSDYAKTEEQVGSEVCHAVTGVFNCMANLLMVKGVEKYRNNFHLTDEERSALKNELYRSGFAIRTGNHIEERIGSVNFSIVGRNATALDRKVYIEWDNATNERNEICRRMNAAFPRLDCVVGGETGVDIFLKGNDKSQVITYVEHPFTFFGDRCERGGNDYPLYVMADIAYWVSDWQETYRIMKDIE